MLNTIGLIAAYSGVGIGILAAGFVALDLLTPGKLGEVIMPDNPDSLDSRRRASNAGILAGSTLVSLGLVLFFAIFFTGAHWNELDNCAVYGAVAVVLQVLGFVVLDLFTPGKLGDKCLDARYRGAAITAGAMQFAVALPICAALT